MDCYQASLRSPKNMAVHNWAENEDPELKRLLGHRHTLRWDATVILPILGWGRDTRIFIVYAPNEQQALINILDAAEKAFGCMPEIYGSVQYSGYYCYAANAIYDGRDGPTFYEDARKVF